MKRLQSATGSNAELYFGRETEYRVTPKRGFRLKFNSDGVVPSRDLNQPETILPGRASAEPFQGNGSVTGATVFPNDYNQMAYLLSLAFGAPVTEDPSDIQDVTTFASDKKGTKVTLASPVPGVKAGGVIAISGSTNYSGEHRVVSVSGNDVVISTPYVEEVAESAVATAIGWKHTFTVHEQQPSFTVERIHRDIAEHFAYAGCKVSSIEFSASSDGNENVATFNIIGSKPVESVPPIAVSAFSDASMGKVKATVPTGHGIEVGDSIVIAGSAHYNGRHEVTASDGTSVTFKAAYVAEKVAPGEEPSLLKTVFSQFSGVPLKRINTFSAMLYKDGEKFRCASSFDTTIDFGLDGEQRCLGDDGYVSEIPEGNVSVSTNLTALLTSGSLYREGQNNTTVGFRLNYASRDGLGGLAIILPENKIQQSAPPVDSPKGISQSVSVISFDSNPEGGEPTIKIELTNAYPTVD